MTIVFHVFFFVSLLVAVLVCFLFVLLQLDFNQFMLHRVRQINQLFGKEINHTVGIDVDLFYYIGRDIKIQAVEVVGRFSSTLSDCRMVANFYSDSSSRTPSTPYGII